MNIQYDIRDIAKDYAKCFGEEKKWNIFDNLW